MNPERMTPIGQLSASGSGVVRDADGNLLDPVGQIITPPQEEEDVD